MAISPYHAEIVAIQNDVTILEATLATASELQSLDSTQNSCAKSLATNLYDTATPSNRSSLENEAINFNKTIATRTSTIISLTREEIDSLQTTLRILQSSEQSWQASQAANNL